MVTSKAEQKPPRPKRPQKSRFPKGAARSERKLAALRCVQLEFGQPLRGATPGRAC